MMSDEKKIQSKSRNEIVTDSSHMKVFGNVSIKSNPHSTVLFTDDGKIIIATTEGVWRVDEKGHLNDYAPSESEWFKLETALGIFIRESSVDLMLSKLPKPEAAE